MYKVWLEINRKALAHNIKIFRGLISSRTKLWAVVKSNAYGHGLVLFAKLADSPPSGQGVDGFCVDSVVEGDKLREAGITKPILVLGPTLPHLHKAAAIRQITITISNQEAFREWLKGKYKPEFHLKIDTGMHRQGFYLEDLPKLVRQMAVGKWPMANYFKGVYSHLSSAKDINYPAFTEHQCEIFRRAVALLHKAGFRNFQKHIAATGGALANKKYHLDLVRVGIGLYGLWPSRELDEQLGGTIKLRPVLSWFALISEVKKIKRGDYIGYDLTERMNVNGKIAIVPIGYWHGLPRALSSIGEVWLGKNRVKILGRVSMDLIVLDVTGLSCGVNDVVEIVPTEIAQTLGASHYEIITRINPLMKKIVK